MRVSERGLLLVQVDGLSEADLKRGLDSGLMPRLKKRLDGGEMVESPLHTGLPSHTGVVEAGVLYGRSTLPSNQWYDKGTGETPNVTGSYSSDLIEDSFLASGAHGLMEGGSAYLTPLTGNADRAAFALSEMARVRRASGKGAMIRDLAKDWAHLAFSLSTQPLQAVRTVARFGVELVRGIFDRKRSDIPQDFKHDRLKPAVWSAVQNVLLTDAGVSAMTRRMKAGDPAIFADLPAFDDMSHALGPDRAMRSLKALDRQLDTLLKAADGKGRKYNVVIYSDHGQCPNVRFEELYGQSVKDFVAGLLPAAGAAGAARSGAPEEPPVPHVDPVEVQSDPRFAFIDFGPGAHFYFNFSDASLDGTQVDARYPGLSDQVLAHPGVGLVVTREGADTVIRGKQGSLRVSNGAVAVTGTNPLAQYGNESRTVWQVHDMAHREGAGDLMAFGGYANGRLVNFALKPQLGTHGGMGGNQDVAFLIQPRGLNIDTRGDQAADIHDDLRALLPSDSPAAIRAKPYSVVRAAATGMRKSAASV